MCDTEVYAGLLLPEVSASEWELVGVPMGIPVEDEYVLLKEYYPRTRLQRNKRVLEVESEFDAVERKLQCLREKVLWRMKHDTDFDESDSVVYLSLLHYTMQHIDS